VTVNGYTEQQEFSRAIMVLDHLGDEGNPASVIKGEPISGQYLKMSDLSKMFV